MTHTLRITVDSDCVSPARSIATAARLSPLLVLTHRALADLEAELGSYEAAYRHLARVAERAGKPLGVNFPTAEGSWTCFLAPKGWSEERLAGWVAGHHDEIEAAFGPATPLDMEDV
jgi:hypothetical protein